MFQLKVRSYGICPSLPGLFHLHNSNEDKCAGGAAQVLWMSLTEGICPTPESQEKNFIKEGVTQLSSKNDWTAPARKAMGVSRETNSMGKGPELWGNVKKTFGFWNREWRKSDMKFSLVR